LRDRLPQPAFAERLDTTASKNGASDDAVWSDFHTPAQPATPRRSKKSSGFDFRDQLFRIAGVDLTLLEQRWGLMTCGAQES
jgi:hypothetical protein